MSLTRTFIALALASVAACSHPAPATKADALVEQLRGLPPYIDPGRLEMLCSRLPCPPFPVPPVEVKRRRIYRQLFALGNASVEALAKARARLREAKMGVDLPPEEFESVADKVAIAALKISDLINFRGTSYVFDLDRFTSFEGKTGPYLLYASVRIKSILRKASEQGLMQGPISVDHPDERAMVLALDGFDAALGCAYDRRAPHFLAEHAFGLAQSFSGFYNSCPILQEPSAEVRSARLALAATTLRQLELALDLLGIATPERM